MSSYAIYLSIASVEQLVKDKNKLLKVINKTRNKKFLKLKREQLQQLEYAIWLATPDCDTSVDGRS